MDVVDRYKELMKELTKAVKDENPDNTELIEVGFVVCEDENGEYVIPSIGRRHKVTFPMCPTGRVKLTFHVHPFGKPYPSTTDLVAFSMVGSAVNCIGSDEGIICFQPKYELTDDIIEELTILKNEDFSSYVEKLKEYFKVFKT